jgi:hypothetical protein
MSGFRQNNGNDIDNLFWSSWNNSGGLGFVQSDGWDLGNRYSSQNTLGYSVGFSISSGTDLGYLRGNIPPPNYYCSWGSLQTTNVYWNGESSYSSWQYYQASTTSNTSGYDNSQFTFVCSYTHANRLCICTQTSSYPSSINQCGIHQIWTFRFLGSSINWNYIIYDAYNMQTANTFI